MKNVTAILALASIALASPALATPNGNGPPPFQGGGDSSAAALAAQAQLQGQAQGQLQGQSSTNNNLNKNTNTNTNTSGAIAGAISGASSNNSVTVQGDTVNSVALAALASGACTSGSLTAGAEGIGIGFSWSKNYCELIALATAAEIYGGRGEAVLCSGNKLFRETQPAICASSTAITNQNYGGKADIAVSTRSAPLYTTCEVIGNTPHITVPAGMGADPAYVQRAAEACWATR